MAEAEGMKLGKLAQPLRAALTDQGQDPGVDPRLASGAVYAA